MKYRKETMVKKKQEIKKMMNDWIPCKNALYDDFVIACDKHGEIMIGYVYKDDDYSETGYTCESEGCLMYDCVAWMPLPDPYKGEHHD